MSAALSTVNQGTVEYVKLVHYVWKAPDRSSYEPLPEAKVSIQEYHWDYGTPVLHGSLNLYTDADGRFSLSCPHYGSAQWGDDFYESSVQLTNSKVFIHGYGSFGGASGDAISCGYTTPSAPFVVVAPHSGEARVFKNMVGAINRSRTAFGKSRAQQKVIVVNSGTGAGYCARLFCDWNFFSGYNYDDIKIHDASIWGAFGVFTAAHEYGHSLHEKALSGINGGCDGSHQFEVPSSETCAWSEGFADYQSSVTSGLSTGNYSLDAFERNQFYYQGGPHPYVVNMVSGCRIGWRERNDESQDGVTQSQTTRPNSVRDYLSCFQRAVDATRAITVMDSQGNIARLYMDSFSGLGTAPSGWNSGTSPALVKSIYDKNIYNQ